MKRPAVTRSLRSFIQAYKPDHVIVFNDTLQDQFKIDEATILFETLTHLPERLADLVS